MSVDLVEYNDKISYYLPSGDPVFRDAIIPEVYELMVKLSSEGYSDDDIVRLIAKQVTKQ